MTSATARRLKARQGTADPPSPSVTKADCEEISRVDLDRSFGRDVISVVWIGDEKHIQRVAVNSWVIPKQRSVEHGFQLAGGFPKVATEVIKKEASSRSVSANACRSNVSAESAGFPNVAVETTRITPVVNVTIVNQ